MFKAITQKDTQPIGLLALCIHEKAKEHTICNQNHEDEHIQMRIHVRPLQGIYPKDEMMVGH